ncbi:MAG: hypothetical protein C4576_11365 [Desulfobacteraceae bacterium]|nr:MAG: hypothetical protein C4576_11365 [Desulfobacteraceae bacterium]
MAIRLNLYSNAQITLSSKGKRNFERIDWGPGGVKRDALGLPVKDRAPSSKEVKKDADLQKRR